MDKYLIILMVYVVAFGFAQVMKPYITKTK